MFWNHIQRKPEKQHLPCFFLDHTRPRFLFFSFKFEPRGRIPEESVKIAKKNRTFCTSPANDPLPELGSHQRSPIWGAIHHSQNLSDSGRCFGQETAQGSNPRERQSSAKAYSMVKMAGCEYCVLVSKQHPCRPKSRRYNMCMWGIVGLHCAQIGNLNQVRLSRLPESVISRRE